MTQVEIRRAAVSDFLPIAALDREAWRDTPHGEFIPDGEHVWRVWVEHALVYCAVANSAIAGAILAFPCLDGRYWLHKIFVTKMLLRLGIASKLMIRLLQEVDRLHVKVSLTAHPANEPALQLYRQFWFRKEQLVHGYYRKTEDRLILSREPQPSAPG